MAIYLAYETAVEAIAYLRTRGDNDTSWNVPCRKESIRDAIHTAREFKELPTRSYSVLDQLTRPLHILVPDRNQGRPTADLRPHVWSGPIPSRSFIELEPGVFLSTPAFTFLQMATELSLIELVQLGMMLCGFYSSDPSFGRRASNGTLDTPLVELHRQMVASATYFEIDPVCKTSGLKTYIRRAKGCRGAGPAGETLKWVRDTAASHMETALYLLLCLPVRMGGYGLPKPELNPEVTVMQASGSKMLFPDLYWSGPSIDVEYNSDTEHSGPSANYRDSRRMVAIVCNKITYLSIATGQLYRAEDLDNAARGLARMLKHRIRVDADWRARRAQLRSEVLPPIDRYEEL